MLGFKSSANQIATFWKVSPVDRQKTKNWRWKSRLRKNYI